MLPSSQVSPVLVVASPQRFGRTGSSLVLPVGLVAEELVGSPALVPAPHSVSADSVDGAVEVASCEELVGSGSLLKLLLGSEPVGFALLVLAEEASDEVGVFVPDEEDEWSADDVDDPASDASFVLAGAGLELPKMALQPKAAVTPAKHELQASLRRSWHLLREGGGNERFMRMTHGRAKGTTHPAGVSVVRQPPVQAV